MSSYLFGRSASICRVCACGPLHSAVGLFGVDLGGAGEGRMHQCPISFESRRALRRSEPIKLDLSGRSVEIVNNGHSIEVRFEEGSAITWRGKTYGLRQVHFHTPAETLVDGEHHPLETHFVFETDALELLVLAVFVNEGRENRAFARVLQSAEPEESPAKPFPAFDPLPLLPKSLHHYSFLGSLTTPPFSEPVQWIVLSQPVEASKAQLEAAEVILGDNTRPLQALNGREIAVSD